MHFNRYYVRDIPKICSRREFPKQREAPSEQEGEGIRAGGEEPDRDGYDRDVNCRKLRLRTNPSASAKNKKASQERSARNRRKVDLPVSGSRLVLSADAHKSRRLSKK